VVAIMTDAASTDLPIDQQKQFSMLVHLSGIIFPLLGAIVGYIVWKDKGEMLNTHTKSALNFNISTAIYFAVANTLAVVAFFLVIPLFLPVLVWIFYVIMCILAGVKANSGDLFKYPLSISFIK
jgi:uncharacterized protein